jgi:hypothetical protein
LRRRYGDLSQKELANLLEKNGYAINNSTINKYELGTRTPNGEFIYHVSLCLGLKSEEFSGLIEALIGDFARKLGEEISDAALRDSEINQKEQAINNISLISKRKEV